MNELRYALRSLRRSPSFALAAVVALGLGIGATTAVFSVVDGVLLRPLGYAEPDRLVVVYARHPQQGDFYSPSYPDFRDWRGQAGDVFDGMAFLRSESLLLRGTDGAQRLNGAHVSEGFFAVLGTRPLLGRAFLPEEERPGGPRVLVLKYATWQGRFGGDPTVVGRTLDFGEGAYTVIGVMPRDFTYPAWGDVYAPLAAIPQAREVLEQRDFRVDNRVIARLRPGVSEAQGTARLEALSRRLAAAYPAENADWNAMVVGVREEMVSGVRPALLVLFGAVTLVLLVACADVANLLLVRATARSRELMVRAALGASRWRVARLLLAEALLLAVAGGALGLVLAGWGIDLLKAAAPANLPRLDDVGMNAGVLAFTVATALLTALVFGVAPALHAARLDLAAGMREGTRGAGTGARRQRLRSGLVVAQVALALVLLVGAGLLLRSFAGLRRVDPGFDPERLLTLRVEPPAARYDTPEKLVALYRAIEDAVAALPAVERVGFVNHLPVTGTSVVSPMQVEGRAPESAAQDVVLFRVADERYFAALGQQVVKGRGLTAADMAPSATAVVVNEATARQYWPNEEPLGRRITLFKQAPGRVDFGQPVRGEVVGVVRDVIFRRPGEPAVPEAYVPLPVNPWRSAFLTVRTRGSPEAVVGPVRRAVVAVDADIPVAAITPVAELLADRLAEQRFSVTLLAAFAGSALLLAAIGVYGVMSYAVAQREREIGVRTALGAQRADVLRLILGDGARLALAGVLLGTALAGAATRLLASMVYGVGVRDATTFAGGAALLGAVALLASYVPARRAARVDPSIALRAE
jgi:putative ABC transport system permease protein